VCTRYNRVRCRKLHSIFSVGKLREFEGSVMLSELLSLLVCHCVLSVINKEIIIIIIIINYSFSATCYIA